MDKRLWSVKLDLLQSAKSMALSAAAIELKWFIYLCIFVFENIQTYTSCIWCTVFRMFFPGIAAGIASVISPQAHGLLRQEAPTGKDYQAQAWQIDGGGALTP